MNYQLELLISSVDVDLSVSDRFENTLSMDIQQNKHLTRLSTIISIPNKIIVTVKKNSPDGYAILEGVSLGNIRFNKDALSNLFVFHYEYGMSCETDWSYDGEAHFSFFEFSAIKYHLLMKTQI